MGAGFAISQPVSPSARPSASRSLHPNHNHNDQSTHKEHPAAGEDVAVELDVQPVLERQRVEVLARVGYAGQAEHGPADEEAQAVQERADCKCVLSMNVRACVNVFVVETRSVVSKRSKEAKPSIRPSAPSRNLRRPGGRGHLVPIDF